LNCFFKNIKKYLSQIVNQRKITIFGRPNCTTMKNLLFLMLSISAISYGQSKFTVYFDTDASQLKTSELIRFDNFFRNKKVKFTKLIGYCDYRASNGYNDTLAFNRAKFVKGIIEKVTDQKQIEIESKGENFKQNSNLTLNRKVEIYYEEIPKKEIEAAATNDLNNQVITAKVGDKLVLKNLYFYNRSGVFRPESRPVLEELLAVMKKHPKLKIEIQGHICCQEGTDIENTSEVRALAVYNYLKANNIDPNRLSYKSFGSTKPIHKIPEKNEEERNENRRVEIQIIEN
jgi:outer membrane protein OmpA-like peptidoglycan-associated protein